MWCRHGGKHYIRNSHLSGPAEGPSIRSSHHLRACGHWRDGVAKKLFLAFLFSDKEVGIQFLKDLGLLRSSVVCSVCVDAYVKDAFRWRCRKKISASQGNVSTSIRHGSWFTQSNLNFMEVLFLTYDIMRRVPAQCI